MTPDDPVRLVAGGTSDLRELLRSARLDEPSPARLEHLQARLAPVVGGAAPAAPGPGLGGLGAKAWLAIALVGGAALVATVAWRGTAAPGRPVAARQAELGASPAVAVEPAAPATAPIAPIAPMTALEPPAVSAPASPTRPGHSTEPRAPRPAPAAPPAPAPSPTLPEPALPASTAAGDAAAIEAGVPPAPGPAADPELDLLGPAHAALQRGQVERALTLAADHARRHPDGVMREEREAITIEALTRLGRRDEARAHLARFVGRFPRSAYRARLEGAVGEPSPR